MPEWGSRLVARLGLGSPDRCSRGRERIPNFILDGENLWKGDSERRKQRTRASVRVGARSACGGAAGSVTVARVSVTRGVAAGCAGAGGSPQGSDRSLAGAAQKRLSDEAARWFYQKPERSEETQPGSTRECKEVERNR
jgi:hypothetical protein